MAEKFSLKIFLPHGFIDGADVGGWLHDDWHTIMELCEKHGVWVKPVIAKSLFIYIDDKWNNSVFYADHNYDANLAERIARMMALMEVEL